MTDPDFPNDDNGQALRRMLSDGDRLHVPRDIDFSIVFRSDRRLGDFISMARKLDCVFAVEEAVEDGATYWDVTITRYMPATHAAITQFEKTLEAFAGPFGGALDGWGCFRRDQND